MVRPDESSSKDDTFKILLATDVHLGFMEKDPVRGNDSLVTFEEILEKAKNNDVDFILLGGDLFHENKPSRRILHGCISLMRKYCLGEKPVQFEFISDQSVNFEHCNFPYLNYEDPNLNISFPIFSIHGNHDDPTGQGNLCSLDLLHTTGFINYFGKSTSLEKITLSPLLMQKGNTKLAMFGLGSIRDERLHRMFLNKNVSMLRPREDQDDWFNLFVIHQNRYKHSATKYIPEQFLDDFLDLVLWGHEHECRIDPEWNGVQNFYVCQPGSSIATSMSPGEAAPKHVGLLYVNDKNFKINKLPLETVRQFYTEDIVFSETSLKPEDPNVSSKMEKYCMEKVEFYLEKAAQTHSGNSKQPNKPLIRLRVDYSGGFEPFSSLRFGQKFVDKVANPKEIITFHRKKATVTDKKSIVFDSKALSDFKPETLDAARVEDIVHSLLSDGEMCHKLQLLTEKGLGNAVREFVDKEEKDAICELVKCQLKKTQKYLNQQSANEDNIETLVHQYKEERTKKKNNDEGKESLKESESLYSKRTQDAAADDVISFLNSDDDDYNLAFDLDLTKNKKSAPSKNANTRMISDSDSDESSSVINQKKVTTRGRGRGRGARGHGRGRGARTKASVVTSDIGSYFTQSPSSKRAASPTCSNEVIISDDSDSNIFEPSSKIRKTTSGKSSANTTRNKPAPKRRGLTFDDSDD